jgi:hypothetical protein
MIVHAIHSHFTVEDLGYIPQFLNSNDPRPMKEQINTSYVGGWHPFNGFRMDDRKGLHYPGDPPQYPLAMIKLENGRDEVAYFYPFSWFAIVQADGSFEVARLD